VKKNTPVLWDGIWKHSVAEEQDVFALFKEEKGIRWQRMEKVTFKEFGSFEGLKAIEIGAGAGTNSALIASRGADVTVLDYSEGALKRAKTFFQHNKVNATFIRRDALAQNEDLFGKFDIAMSFGLTEHFKGENRERINRIHFDLLREGGIAFISVPNRYNFPYRINKFILEVSGLWKVGEEYPYSRKELQDFCLRIGVGEYSFFGDSFIESFRFIDPLKAIRRLLNLQSKTKLSLKKQMGTSLDEYLSYALVLCGKK
jgi:2-polyprenyl-3-methyl-5-hydroxy-6-metoxy-1,4-benzoquinol methylase